MDSEGAVGRLIRACIDDASHNEALKARHRQDWRNLLFHRGGDAQWTIWDKTSERYVERGTDPEKGGLPDYIPRCVTNVFANKIDGIAAILTQAEPAKEYQAATDDEEDVAAAAVAEHAIPALLDEIGYADDLKPRATPLVCLTDKVLFVPYYDPDPKYGMDIIPDYRCPSCGSIVPPEEGADENGEAIACPDCLEAGVSPDAATYEEAIDHTGTPMGTPTPIGKLCCELVPGFEASLPKHAKMAHAQKVDWILTHTRMSPEAIGRRWEKAKALDLEKKRSGAGKSGLQRVFADSMALLSSPLKATQSRASEGLTDPVVYRLMHDPITTDDYHFPDGLYVTMVDDKIVEAGPLPVKDDQGRPIKNAVIWQFESAPGTAFGKPPADDLVPLQESRNVLESLNQLILMHEAAPRTYVPLTVTLENEITGVPGQTVHYRSLVAGDKPTTEAGRAAPASLPKQIELIDAKMDELSKLNSVLQGVRPDGDPTLGEVERLEENGLRAFRPALNRLVDVEKQLCRLVLYIARDSAWSPRFRKVMGDNGEWDLEQFTGADLTGSIDIRVDSASAWPKSPLMQRLMAKEAFAMGLFPPAATDPELAQKLLSMLNLAFLKPSIDLDRKQVARKISRWKAARMPQDIAPPDPLKESLNVHFVLLTNFLKSEIFEQLEELNQPVAMAMKQHVQMIGSILSMQAAAAMAAQAGPAKPGDEKKPNGPDPLEGALKQGALRPAGGEPPAADPMDGALAAGALQPAGAAGVSADAMIAARQTQPLDQARGGPM